MSVLEISQTGIFSTTDCELQGIEVRPLNFPFKHLKLATL